MLSPRPPSGLELRLPAVFPTVPIAGFLAVLVGLGLVAVPPLPAQEMTSKHDKAEEPAPPPPEEVLSETRHTVRVDGVEIPYRATAGNLVLATEEGEAQASVFFVAYQREGVDDPAQRPVTFVFNGGPGSSSVWLHLGAFGPRRVAMTEEGWALPPPGRLVDNEATLLDVSDLVFIDPVTTGYSRAVPGVDDREYHGVREDVEAVGAFIRLWTTRFERWASPKLVAGESYGTTRAAALARHLGERWGLYLNGVVLVSSILDFQTARFDAGNDLPYALFLPTYTATARYHGRLAPELAARPLPELLDEVEEFALGEYMRALLLGARLPQDERRRVAERLARYTGLAPGYLQEVHLRPAIHRFTKELRRDEGLTVGRLDSRFTGVDRDRAGERPEADPSYAAIHGPFGATLNDYLRRELGYETDVPYEILTGRVRPWSYGEFENRYVNVAEDLRRAMARNPHLRVFVANGYYDLATPYFATEFTFDHLSFEPGFAERVEMGWYESGHMMYIHAPSRDRLKSDLAAFIAAATAPPPATP